MRHFYASLKIKVIIWLGIVFSLPSFSAEILIQTGDSSTSSTGFWNRATGASMPLGSNQGMYATVGGAIENYRFETQIPQTTSYTLQVYNTCYSPRSHQVTQYLEFGNTTETFVTDQDCQTDPFVGQWRTLGTYRFEENEIVAFTITTEGSNNRYVGATAIRYLYDEVTEPAENQPPQLQLSSNSISVNANELITLTASAFDPEEGDLSSQIQWSSPLFSTTGAEFSTRVGTESFVVNVSVSDNQNVSAIETVQVQVNNVASVNRKFSFGCELGSISSLNLTTYNAIALPNVGAMCDRYTAQLTNNDNNRTLFYNGEQGRIDGVVARYPLEAILRNVGIAPVNQPSQPHVVAQSAYNFVGLHIHHIDYNQIDSAHLVVGQRGATQNTIEGKQTVSGTSYVNDIGHNQLPNGRADIRLVIDSGGVVTAYWQEPNLSGNPALDNWTLYRNTGALPGSNPNWGSSGQVIVGIITYAYYQNGLPFWGVADQLEINEE
ncbi:hypothetical protein [Pleionea sediminis]|uniref:golvesin C-terminal-like domain-containing protein n=1 Tax=Pleionea sediminis TaxID=2569479 RepID=UPI001184A934|nr:hypothetical protein [Pleionea sediminis]